MGIDKNLEILISSLRILRDTAVTTQHIKDITFMHIHCMLCNDMFHHVVAWCIKHFECSGGAEKRYIRMSPLL